MLGDRRSWQRRRSSCVRRLDALAWSRGSGSWAAGRGKEQARETEEGREGGKWEGGRRTEGERQGSAFGCGSGGGSGSVCFGSQVQIFGANEMRGDDPGQMGALHEMGARLPSRWEPVGVLALKWT